jgi:aspartyl aminopeptidase
VGGELVWILTNTIHDPNTGGKYYFTRNRSTLVAFAVGGSYAPGTGGFKVIGGHTDSPNLKVKPRSKRSDKTSKSIQIGAECYGGGLWHTWFDRDLGLSGRVFVRQADGRIVQKLIKIDRAILRIPNLAIHLRSDDERKAFAVNKEDHLSPILAGKIEEALTGAPEEKDSADGDKKDKDKTKKDGWTEHQEPLLVQLLADELFVNASDIVDFELNMFDIQKAALGGVHSEFLYSARLDNLASCFLAIESLLDCIKEDGFLENDKDINMIVLYDHEEVGSASAYVAGNAFAFLDLFRSCCGWCCCCELSRVLTDGAFLSPVLELPALSWAMLSRVSLQP